MLRFHFHAVECGMPRRLLRVNSFPTFTFTTSGEKQKVQICIS